MAQVNGIEGRFRFSITVDKEGCIKNAKLISRDLHILSKTHVRHVNVPYYFKSMMGDYYIKYLGKNNYRSEEALITEGLRMINKLPKFIPGEENGEKVSVHYTLPITWRLH